MTAPPLVRCGAGCGWLPASRFYRNRTTATGYTRVCKHHADARRARYARNNDIPSRRRSIVQAQARRRALVRLAAAKPDLAERFIGEERAASPHDGVEPHRRWMQRTRLRGQVRLATVCAESFHPLLVAEEEAGGLDSVRRRPSAVPDDGLFEAWEARAAA